jgi:hypothetical protein
MTDDRPPIDWPHVLGDIAAEFGEPGIPLGTRRLARVMGVSRGTVENVLNGGDVLHAVGERWSAMWCLCMVKTEADIPRRWRQKSASKAA